MDLSNELELKDLINKRNGLINQRAFMRRNCDTLVLESKRLSYEQYNNILTDLSQKIHLSGVGIRNLRAKVYPEMDMRINRVLSGLEHILRGPIMEIVFFLLVMIAVWFTFVNLGRALIARQSVPAINFFLQSSAIAGIITLYYFDYI